MLSSYSFKIHFNIILPSKPRSSNWPFSFRFSHHNSVQKTCAVLRFYAVKDGRAVPAFWDNMWVPSSWTACPLKMGLIGCSETSIRKYNPTLLVIQKERRSHVHRGGSIKWRNYTHISLLCVPHVPPISSSLSFFVIVYGEVLYTRVICCPLRVDVTSHTELCRWVRGMPAAKQRACHTCPCTSAGDRHVDQG
jgi:hypothetical protein